jgi:hypothetical protein
MNNTEKLITALIIKEAAEPGEKGGLLGGLGRAGTTTAGGAAGMTTAAMLGYLLSLRFRKRKFGPYTGPDDAWNLVNGIRAGVAGGALGAFGGDRAGKAMFGEYGRKTV